MVTFPTTRSVTILGLLLVLIAALTPSVARADPTTDAKDMFDRGRTLRGQGDCASAVSLFRNAYELYPAGLGSLRNLAECEESLGHFASARRAWLELKRALLQTEESKYAGWRQDAEQAAAQLASKVATLTIDLRVVDSRGQTVSRDGIEVTLNGERLAPSVVGTPLERDPGRYFIRAFGTRAKAASELMFDLVAAQSRQVVLGVVVTAEPTQEEPPSHGAQTRRAGAWTAIGVGAAALIGAGVSLFVYQSSLDELASHCSKQGAQYDCMASQEATLQPTIDRGRTASTLANVFGVVGAVGLAGGLVLLATTAPHSTTNAAIVLSPMGVTAVGRF